ncbi:MAG: acetate--CoA ligase family protein [Paracoccaceae bacterium]
MGRLSRLLNPRSIAVIGGGVWCAQVIGQAQKFGFTGDIWPVHPKADAVADQPAFASIASLPGVPDAVFVGINRHATVEAVRVLAHMGAGGAVCFASGFSEAMAEDAEAGDLQAALVDAAGDMPILGPNCYGFINALDGTLLWPDQHGCTAQGSGVAILTQSSNIAINLTMQARALPTASVLTCGNMAQTSQAQLAFDLLDDPRVTAIGLHIEGFGDLRAWEALAVKAHAKGIPIVAVKIGASQQAQAATVSHTASLAGSDAGAQAFLDRLGIARVTTLPDLLETLKLLHVYGALPNKNIASISCSGGEASLIADMATRTTLKFAPLNAAQTQQLRTALGPMVALSNPLDYHTYVWGNVPAMTAAWSGMTGADIAMTLSVVDYPTTDASDWQCTCDAALAVRANTGACFGVVASLPELMPPDVAAKLMSGGVIPFCGLREALAAIEASGNIKPVHDLPALLPGPPAEVALIPESDAKQALSAFGLPVPSNRTVPVADVAGVCADLTGPFAIKAVGLAHKSDSGAVALNICAADAPKVAARMGTDTVLIEEMIPDAVTELLIGVVRDPAHGFMLTLGAGGVLAEIMQDTTSLLLPITEKDLQNALTSLRIAPILDGYRGAPAADLDAVIRAILAIQDYVIANAGSVSEVEINPLLCTQTRAVAVDALIRKA